MSAGAAAVGLRLRQERLKRGWSQEGLSRGICAASYLSKIEQGRVQAAPELLALLMKRLDLPWYGENLPELEGLVERRYAQLLDGEQEAFQDSRAAFSQALETILSSPLAADGRVLEAVVRGAGCPVTVKFRLGWDKGSINCVEFAQAMEAGKYPPYKASGMAYIAFAQQEKPLFRLLFMRDRSHEDASPRLGDDVEPLLDLIQQAAGISRESARMFHLEMWIYVHGIAAMAATSFLDWDTELISASLTDAYRGLLARFKEKEAQE